MTSPRQRLTWTGEVASQLPWSHAVIWVGVVLAFWVRSPVLVFSHQGRQALCTHLHDLGPAHRRRTSHGRRGIDCQSIPCQNQVTPERSSWGLVAPLDSTWFWNPLSRRETTSVCSRLVLVDGKFPCRGGNGGLLGVA